MPNSIPGDELFALLCSRLCHDVISPVGALNNGIELLQELGPGELQGDALTLVAESGQRAAAILKFYRLAYGRAGVVASAGGTREWVEAAVDFAETRKLKLVWPQPTEAPLAHLGAAVPECRRVVLNGVAVLCQLLPQGGSAVLLPLPPDGMALLGRGRGLKLESADHAALLSSDALDPKTAQIHFLARIASAIGLVPTLLGGRQAVARDLTLPPEFDEATEDLAAVILRKR